MEAPRITRSRRRQLLDEHLETPNVVVVIDDSTFFEGNTAVNDIVLADGLGMIDPISASTENVLVVDEEEMLTESLEDTSIVTLDKPSQTTPGLAKNGPPDVSSLAKAESASLDDEEQSCPICFELWTSAGDHRICSLNCGHLFGRSCIEKWLQNPKNKSCPQCKSAAKRRDIRNIYAKSVKVLDTTDREQAKKKLAEEKYKRSIAEENEAKALLKYHLLKVELEKLKADVQQSQSRAPAGVHDRQPVAERSCAFVSSQSSQPSSSQLSFSRTLNLPERGSQLKAITKSYRFQKTLQVSQKEARVVAFDKGNMLMAVSRPSQNQLFNGFGILKISSLDARSTEFISVHQKTIRDMKFNQIGDQLLLTGSMDKTLKITSVISNSVVQSYNCAAPVWACSWNERNINYVFAGLQNGTCVAYDVRKTNESLAVVKPRNGVPCPIVSLAYVPPPATEGTVGCEGLLVGTIKGGWFLQCQQEVNFIDHQLLFAEGSCCCLSYEASTRHCLLSQRPGKNSARSVHAIYNLIGDGSPENPLYVNNVQQCYGGNRAQNLTRSHLFTCPDDNSRLMLAAGDEASSSVVVFDGGRGNELQKLSCTGGTIFDVLPFDAYDSSFLVALTEQKLNFFKWQ